MLLAHAQPAALAAVVITAVARPVSEAPALVVSCCLDIHAPTGYERLCGRSSAGGNISTRTAV